MGPGQGARTSRRPGGNRESCSHRPTIAGLSPYIRAMRRTWISRSLASVLSLWLAVCLAEPVQLHTCAMHGGLAIVQNGTVGAHGPDHHTARTAIGHDHKDQSSDSQSRQCSCLGDCNSGNSPIGIATAAISPFNAPLVEASPNSFAHAPQYIVAPRFLLPFSNGPPANSSRA